VPKEVSDTLRLLGVSYVVGKPGMVELVTTPVVLELIPIRGYRIPWQFASFSLSQALVFLWNPSQAVKGI
jgi:hypothetical protein